MYIAQKYRETNIIEYILYMWHIEEMVRSMNLEIGRIETEIIGKFKVEGEVLAQMKRWYADIINQMTQQGVREAGHLEELRELMNEIHYLHQSLLTLYQDKEYQKLVADAQPNLDILKGKSENRNLSEIELAMNGLFGVLVLKLKQQQVSDATQDAITSISKMMAHLAKQYNKMRLGQLALPKVMEN